MITSIQKLNKVHSHQVACLHIEGIPTGFISSLGAEFVKALYESIAEDRNSFGFVSVENDNILGFVAFSTNLSKLYKYVVLKKGFKFAFILARKMCSIKACKKVLGNILYPSKMKKMELPDAELLSIVVAPEGRGIGIAKQLIEKGLQECQNRRIDKVKVLVAADNVPANRLYQKAGFKLATQIDSHGVSSNIYVISIST